MELDFKNIKNKTIVEIAMNTINNNASFREVSELDWIKYSENQKDYYYLKSAIKTQKNTFNFSIPEKTNNIYYCICLSENKLHVFKISTPFNKKIVITEEELESNSVNERICVIEIDNLEYWEILQNNDDRIENLATKSRIENFAKNEKDKQTAKFKSKEEFLEWYKKQPKKCCYCGVKEEYLKKYFNQENEQYKEARQRGQYLEIERIVTAPKTKNIYSKENCALVCYICNNAKSDFLSPINFKPIAKGINEFWKKILKKSDLKYKKIVFPEKSKIWDKQ